jgi:predicted secreted protein
MDSKNLITKIGNVENEVLDYILNTEHYLFYWISNEEVQNFILEYPDDYKDMFYIIVVNVSASPTIRIYFEDHPDGVKYIERYAVLSAFKDSAKARWLEWNGMVKEKQIAEKEKQLEYYKEQLEKTEKELEYLKNNE